MKLNIPDAHFNLLVTCKQAHVQEFKDISLQGYLSRSKIVKQRIRKWNLSTKKNINELSFNFISYTCTKFTAVLLYANYSSEI